MIIKDINIIKEIKRKILIPTKTSESVRLGILLAIVGGFLDAYTFICRGGVFANAQTGNIVLIGVESTKGNFKQALMAFLPILAFIVGIVVTEKINEIKFPSSASVTYSERIILLIEIIVLFIIGFIPTTVSNAFKTIRYIIVIFSFIVGACLAGILTLHIGVKSIWFTVIVLLFSLSLFSIDEYRFKSIKRTNRNIRDDIA